MDFIKNFKNLRKLKLLNIKQKSFNNEEINIKVDIKYFDFFKNLKSLKHLVLGNICYNEHLVFIS